MDSLVYIYIYIDTAHPPVTSVRLIPSSNSGLVQVRYNNTWGTICSFGWSLQDAHVVCRQLGYINATRILPSSNQNTPGIIWLSGVQCQGTEKSIGACHIETIWGQTTCTHSQDVAVECTSNHTPL